MEYSILKGRDFTPELIFSASRSSGAGGQNVNKVNTKIELRFNINTSNLLTETEKTILIQKLASKISGDNEIIITAQTDRSQLKNKEKSIEKFYSMLEKALTPRKRRKPTKPTTSSKEKRLEGKRVHSEKKTTRKKIDLGN